MHDGVVCSGKTREINEEIGEQGIKSRAGVSVGWSLISEESKAKTNEILKCLDRPIWFITLAEPEHSINRPNYNNLY